MADLKEMIISSMPNGKEVLEEIKNKRKDGNDFSQEMDRTKKTIAKYHPPILNLKVNEIIEINKDAKCFRFVSTKDALPVFEAGQYINIFTTIDGVRTSRPYSISSSPKQRAYFEVTIARVPNGFVSEYFLENVKVGDEFTANGPAGYFHFNPIFHSKKSVMIAGGSGITPFLSMSREILQSGADREVHIIYGCRNSSTVLFLDELNELSNKFPNFKFSLVLSEPEEGFKGTTGFLDAKCISSLVDDIDGSTFYSCGPLVMTDLVAAALEELNVPKKRARREMFGTSPDVTLELGWPKEVKKDSEFNITINGDKVIKGIAGESLLVALERNNVRVNVCCRSGECSLCRVQLIGGNVFLSKGALHRHADEVFGYIHSCKAYPISDVSIVI